MRKWLTTIITLLVLGGILASSAVAMSAPGLDTTRTGAWLDSVTFTTQGDYAAAVSQLQADQLDVYMYSMSDQGLYATVQADPNLAYTESYQSYNELSFNPYGPLFYDGRLNPFSNPKIREAMNRLVDREYIAQAIFGGLAAPLYTIFNTNSADYTRHLNAVQDLEDLYAYNPSQAEATINTEMLALGATRDGDGHWVYAGNPVVIIFIIRLEDQRLALGDYVADQLESIGFSVDRQYKTSSEASAIWLNSDPGEGLWHIYTGGWVQNTVSRDSAENFAWFYTSLGWPSNPLWQAYTPTPEFLTVVEKLWNRDFTSMAEREELVNTALPLSLQDSARIWIVDKGYYWPRRADTVIASSPVLGPNNPAWPFTARFADVEGGNLRIAQLQMLMDPYNPLNGSSWMYDRIPMDATKDYDLMSDLSTGLYWPQRIQSAELVARQGLVVTSTHDWLDLSFAPDIPVPADVWVDWDAVSQTFITAAEKYTETITADFKSTVTYPADLFDTVTWHDGSPLDMGDFILKMILTFDRAKVDSAIYDEEATYQFDTFMSYFKGLRIVSVDPLVIETYHNQYNIDAELDLISWWPNYNTGTAAWHNLAVGIRAEADQALAFSANKAELLGVDWANYIAGDSLSVLKGFLDESVVDCYIPYSPTMGAYVTTDEAMTRYGNLNAWYNTRGHFWLGTGPFYLVNADYDLKKLELARYAAYPDPADKWDYFVLPPTLSINENAGAPGSFLNLTGDNYPPNQTAIISVNGVVVGTTPVNSSGGFVFTLTTEQASEGIYYASATVNPSAEVKFVLDAQSELVPLEGSYPTFPLPEDLAYLFETFLSLIHK